MSERYITHIRITEDSRYPTTPPPPNSPPENKKERVILLAVRSTGRVRMHKARENPNGTFSVGKTWNFEELTIVESFGNRAPRSAEEAEQFRWAGDTGFAVTILKPYFWQTNSSMEKSYFIGSLVKVYKRYTEGRLPQLIGFTPVELDQIFAQADQPTLATGQPYQAAVASGRAASADRGAAGRSLPQVPSVMPGAPPPLNARRGATLPAQDRPSQPPEALRVGQLRPTQSREQVRPYTPPGRTTPSSEQNRSSTPESQKAGVNRRGGFYQTPAETGASPTNGLGISDSGPNKTNGDSTRRTSCVVVHAQADLSQYNPVIYQTHLRPSLRNANALHLPPLPTAFRTARNRNRCPASATNDHRPRTYLSSLPTDTRSSQVRWRLPKRPRRLQRRRRRP